jgi:hypothetical protein
MRTYQARVAVDDDAQLRAYADVFGRALRHLHASRHSGNANNYLEGGDATSLPPFH